MYIFHNPKDGYIPLDGDIIVEKYSMLQGELFRIDRETLEEAQIEYEELLKERVVEDILEKCLFLADNAPDIAKQVIKALVNTIQEEYGIYISSK